jgi:hypothetical protein
MPEHRPLAERVWEKVEKTPACWLWRGTIDRHGYGTIRQSRCDGGRQLRAHRAVYELVVGPAPDGLDLDHLCRNRRCVRPDHLEPVTRRTNLLRGDTVTARNAAKTHCKNGHPFNEQHTYRRKDGSRFCRTCLKDARRRKGA